MTTRIAPRNWGTRGTTPVVAIQPLDDVDPAVVQAVADRIERMFAVDARVLPARLLPEAAFYQPRMRYRGDRIIHWLGTQKPQEVSAMLGLMSRDLSATKGGVYDWGVMGLASPARAVGVVSTHRLGRHRASAGLVTRRASQVAVHELGHSFGLPHCPESGCIMNDAQGGITPVDRSSGQFCESCRNSLGSLLRR